MNPPTQIQSFISNPLLLLLILLPLIPTINAFNLDITQAQIFTDPSSTTSSRSSYFGYSVAIYSSSEDSQLLIGAPRANSSRPADLRDGINEPGAIYHCKLDDRKRCKEWLIDPVHDNRIFGQYTSVRQKKDNAWLGATISIENSMTPRIAVCAPNWKKNYRVVTFNEHWFMNGMCYSLVINDSSIFSDNNIGNRYFPLMDEDEQIVTVGNPTGDGPVNLYYYGMGQAGFSAHIEPDTHRLLIGSPGLFHWTGSVMMVNDDTEHRRNSFDAFLPKVIGDARFEYSDYFGYSITSGHFQKRSTRLYAAGAPRSADTLGKVVIFTFPIRKKSALSIKSVIYGEQYGEYFGASVTACDVNNDGKDELIVAAPLWSKISDEGRVYVYTFEDQSHWRTQRLEGDKLSGRFGSSISCLGDLDQDGYKDIAIGAPYEYENQGSVYIYRGGTNGIKSRPSQRITASDLGLSNLRGFGAALSEPARDVDGNGHPDLAIGAYLSGHAVLLPSRKVVVTQIELLRPVGEADFMLAENFTSFEIDVCASYHGTHAPSVFYVKMTVKFDEFQKRIQRISRAVDDTAFEGDYKNIEILTKDKRKCEHFKVYLKANIQNMVDPIEIIGQLDYSKESFCTDCPVIDPSSKNTDNLKVAFALDCGIDNTCISDLQVNVSSNLKLGDRYVIGSKSNLNLTVIVKNMGEPAYGAQAKIYIPEPITPARIPVECNKQLQVNETLEIVCNLGNPLRLRNTILMELDMGAIEYKHEYQEIRVNVTTQSDDVNVLNNNGSLRINYGIDADLAIVGKSEEDYYSYLENEVNDTTSKLFTFHHIYELQKIGVTPVDEAILSINLPMTLKDVKIAKLNQVRGSINGQRYNCKNEISNSTLIYETQKEILDNASSSDLTLLKERAFYVNCSNSNVTCQIVRCIIGPFIETTSVAKLIVTIDLEISNVTVADIDKRNLIFVSEGIVKIISPNMTVTNLIERPDFKQISTIFIRRRNPKGISIWIFVFSVLLGLILLIMISLLLFKLGFFERTGRDDLQTSKLTDEANQESTSDTIEEMESIK